MKKLLKNLVLNKILKIPTPESYLSFDKQGRMRIDGEEASEAQLLQIGKEVEMLEGTLIWGILTDTMEKKAQEVILNKSQNFQDVLNGKMILYVVDVQKQLCKMATAAYKYKRKRIAEEKAKGIEIGAENML